MLPYINRLTNKKDFEAVHQYGSFFSFGDILLKAKKNKSSLSRLGFLVGLNFSKKATERNRLKRQLRAISGDQLGKIKKGIDIIVMIKKGGKNEIKTDSLEYNFKKALEKGKLIN